MLNTSYPINTRWHRRTLFLLPSETTRAFVKSEVLNELILSDAPGTGDLSKIDHVVTKT